MRLPVRISKELNRNVDISNIAENAIERDWATNPRWARIERVYDAADVIRLRGTVRVEHSLARRGAEQLWRMLQTGSYVSSLDAMTGAQAVEMVKAGLKAIYVSGWQVAADANLSEQVYPDQSLYAGNSVPAAVRRISNALRRADQIEWADAFVSGESTERSSVSACAAGGAHARRSTLRTPTNFTISERTPWRDRSGA